MLPVDKPYLGVRDRRQLERLAAAHGLRLVAAHDMPANNLTLAWERV